jgi:diguanylate cyclase (GGDEF)-like protein/putative nucleotidyltransferase with HDIG domain
MSVALSGLDPSRIDAAPAADGKAPYRALPVAARIYVGAVVLAGALLLALRMPRIELPHPWLFVALVALAGAAAYFKVTLPLPDRPPTMSASYAVEFASLLLVGADATMLIAAVGAFSQCTFGSLSRNPIHRTTFSVAVLVVTAQVAGLVYRMLGGVPVLEAAGPRSLQQAVVGAAIAYFTVNVGLVAGVLALDSREPLRAWKEQLLWGALSYFVGAGAAAVGAFLLSDGCYWLAPLVLAPVYLTYRAHAFYLDRLDVEQRHSRQVSELHLATIEALALAIDAKDQSATSHLRRVQVYATGLAEALGMSPSEVQGVRTAALLHDIGKLAVPDHILAKPGPLTPEEFQKVECHPQIGAEILGSVPFPYPVAPLVLSHHERWDGRGYPHGLEADEIPLGARILAVVDQFDALTSERSYHSALGRDEALARIREDGGRGLDPAIVELFGSLLPTLEAEAERLGGPSRRLSFAAPGAGARPAAGFAAEGRGTDVFTDIALAHREIYALYELAHSMGSSLGVGDTMSLVSSKLASLVPFASCALFLRHDETESMRCAFAVGSDAERIGQFSIRLGGGLAGWVGRNRRPLVNARPSADFEAAGLGGDTPLLSALVCPLVFNDQVIGAMAVYHAEAAFYTDDHRRLLERVCEMSAGVIHNSVVYEQTRQDSLTDPMTGLQNTRSLYTHLTRELARAERLGSEVSLVVLDLDGFKEINDTYGHHTGDRALREVARVLKSGIRPYDICVRYAGDEFVVVLSGCGPEEAEHKQRELQAAVNQIAFDGRPGEPVRVASSFGAASFPSDGRSYEALLATADRRMYDDKARRKRRASPEVQSPSRHKRSSVFAKIAAPSPSNRTH